MLRIPFVLKDKRALVVDMKGRTYIAKHFATDPSKSSWDPNADINGNGKVDMKDIGIVVEYFGKHDS